jgi:Holliday junction DNA helicase RuvA
LHLLKGQLIECQLTLAILEVNGIGYEVHVPLTTVEKASLSLGDAVKLFTHATYREDSQTLYGFIDRESRDFFRMIVDKVSGIGPKIALNLLGSLSLQTLKMSIASGDVAMLSKAQGLGKKTAERIVVELKDKVLPKELSQDTNVSTSSLDKGQQADISQNLTNFQDAVSALLTLGYKATDADLAIRRASESMDENASTEELIRLALTKGKAS